MTYGAAKITENTTKIMQKHTKNYLEIIAPMLVKAVFNFVKMVAK